MMRVSILKNFVNKSLKKFSKGWYIVNYHEIIENVLPKTNFRIPSIYTSLDRFMEHINFYRENFNILSIKEGIEKISNHG